MFACIHVPTFTVAAALRAEPELRARAVGIFEGKPPLEKLMAVNEKAAALGIAAGMTKAQAELCAELTLRPRSALQESAAHAALLDCAESFSPCVENAACDTVLLDLAGMNSLLGSLPEISQAITNCAAGLSLKANVATASNPDAALLAARGFNGVTMIPAGEEAARLGSLPVSVLFEERLQGEEKQAADRLQETFERWGIRTLRALAALPEVALSERLGQEGLWLRKLAAGAVSRPLVPVEEPLTFEEGIELEHPIVLLEPLAFLLNHLLEQICARLGSRALATQELRLTLGLANFAGADEEFRNAGISSESDEAEPRPETTQNISGFNSGRPSKFSRTLRLPLPMLDAKVFLKLLQLDLQANPPGAPIMKIHLAAEPARPRSAQGGLFLPPSPEPEKLELTLARIARLVGKEKTGTMELLDTHHPDGFCMRRFVAEAATKNREEKNPESAVTEEKSAVTALRRFRPPVRADVTLDNGEPVYLVCGKKDIRGQVLWKAGPWRFSGDWWEREAWSRDEWDIAVGSRAAQAGETIALYRLVHDRLNGRWFVEGTYD